MILVVQSEPVPLSTDVDGVVRVAGTRVTLETIVTAFNAGATPEQISFDFPTLSLTDVYATVTYYLRHRREVDAYLRQASDEGDALQREMESRFDPWGVRDRLMARRFPL